MNRATHAYDINSFLKPRRGEKFNRIVIKFLHILPFFLNIFLVEAMTSYGKKAYNENKSKSASIIKCRSGTGEKIWSHALRVKLQEGYSQKMEPWVRKEKQDLKEEKESERGRERTSWGRERETDRIEKKRENIKY